MKNSRTAGGVILVSFARSPQELEPSRGQFETCFVLSICKNLHIESSPFVNPLAIAG